MSVGPDATYSIRAARERRVPVHRHIPPYRSERHGRAHGTRDVRFLEARSLRSSETSPSPLHPYVHDPAAWHRGERPPELGTAPDIRVSVDTGRRGQAMPHHLRPVDTSISSLCDSSFVMDRPREHRRTWARPLTWVKETSPPWSNGSGSMNLSDIWSPGYHC